jgi:hypothetical protein
LVRAWPELGVPGYDPFGPLGATICSLAPKR